jgi:small conductance mechanosensitive channel
LRKRIKKAFDDEGIEIPWPHTKLYFGNAPRDFAKEETGKKVKAKKTRRKPPASPGVSSGELPPDVEEPD